MRTLHIGISVEDAKSGKYDHAGVKLLEGPKGSCASYACLPMLDRGAAELYRRKIVYDCGDGHDLHLDPGHEFTLEDMEALALALVTDQTPWE